MSYGSLSRSIVALAVTVLSSACSEPTASTFGEAPVAARLAIQTAGSYNLFFMIETPTGLTSVDNSAPVRSFLVVRSEVRDDAGVLATVGKVTYEYCWSRGDYAASAACANGSGSWKRLRTMDVDPVGSASDSDHVPSREQSDFASPIQAGVRSRREPAPHETSPGTRSCHLSCNPDCVHNTTT